MEYTDKQNENVHRSIGKHISHNGNIQFNDERTDFVRQAKFVDLIQKAPDNKSAYVIQRAHIGSRGEEDKDRTSIEFQEHIPESLPVGGDWQNRAHIIKDRELGPLLKHYMVVKNGTSYQLPVKHLRLPKEEEVVTPKGKKKIYIPGQGKADRRGFQPEGFGGNQDLPSGIRKTSNIAEGRDSTLLREYEEEARRPWHGTFKVDSSKYYTSSWAEGTLSIVSTNQPLREHWEKKSSYGDSGFTPSPKGSTDSYGEAEMAGTITIDCGNLMPGINIDPAKEESEIERLETEIGEKITAQRNALIEFLEQSIPEKAPFTSQAGILSHLVTMIAQDLIHMKYMGLAFSEPSYMSFSSSSSFSSSTPSSSSSSTPSSTPSSEPSSTPSSTP